MPEYTIGVKGGLTDEEYAEAEKHLEAQGGKIIKEKGDKGGLSPRIVVVLPDGGVSALESTPHFLSKELSSTYTTQ